MSNISQIEILKNALIEERVLRIMQSIPSGHCPTAYYLIEYNCGCSDGEDIDCNKCRQNFKEAIFKKTKEDVETLLTNNK